MEKIIVKNTCIIINNYSFGDNPKLERFFAIYEPVSHSIRYAGIHYDKENKRLYLPRGIDIWYVESLLDCKAYIEKNKYNEYDSYDDIGVKLLPRDEDQKKALRFAVGRGEFAETQTKSQLSINLNTGKGKTYVAIGTMSFMGIKSVVITYSKSILNQWKKCIIDYTNLTTKHICDVDGSGSIFRLLQKSDEDIRDIRVFLVTHATLKSYGDTYGWDKVTELFIKLRIGMKFYDEAHLNFDNMCMVDFYTNVYKTYYLTATPARSNDDENRIYQTAFKNIFSIDLFHADEDPHTHYIAMRYHSHPTPQAISACKNMYGLDRNKYINYIIENENFNSMSRLVLNFIFKNIMKSPEDKLLIYIGTNRAIEIFYHWFIENYPEMINDIGIFTSIVSDQDKTHALMRRIILTTTKSAGAAIDIKGLKCTLVLAEPFKSEVLARQTLGRTRDKNTYYIEVVDKGFAQCNRYYLSKKAIFSIYALDCRCVDISDKELYDMANRIVKMAESSDYHEVPVPPNVMSSSKEKKIKPFFVGIHA